MCEWTSWKGGREMFCVCMNEGQSHTKQGQSRQSQGRAESTLHRAKERLTTHRIKRSKQKTTTSSLHHHHTTQDQTYLRGHLHGRHLRQQITRTVRKEMVRLKQRRAIATLGVEEGVLPTGMEADPVGQVVGLAVDVPEQVGVVLLA